MSMQRVGSVDTIYARDPAGTNYHIVRFEFNHTIHLPTFRETLDGMCQCSVIAIPEQIKKQRAAFFVRLEKVAARVVRRGHTLLNVRGVVYPLPIPKPLCGVDLYYSLRIEESKGDARSVDALRNAMKTWTDSLVVEDGRIVDPNEHMGGFTWVPPDVPRVEDMCRAVAAMTME